MVQSLFWPSFLTFCWPLFLTFIFDRYFWPFFLTFIFDVSYWPLFFDIFDLIWPLFDFYFKIIFTKVRRWQSWQDHGRDWRRPRISHQRKSASRNYLFWDNINPWTIIKDPRRDWSVCQGQRLHSWKNRQRLCHDSYWRLRSRIRVEDLSSQHTVLDHRGGRSYSTVWAVQVTRLSQHTLLTQSDIKKSHEAISKLYDVLSLLSNCKLTVNIKCDKNG